MARLSLIPEEMYQEGATAQCIHHLFEQQALRTPEAVAASFRRDTLTYRELDRLATQLAQRLRKEGVGPDIRVGLCLDRSLQMLIGILGILKAGGAYVPLDPRLPSERLVMMLEDAAPPVVITSHSLKARCSNFAGRYIFLDEDHRLDGAGQILSVEVTPANAAYVIYTSGSTGRPKGVVVEHGGVVSLLQYMQVKPGIGPEDRLLAITTMCFDISVVDFFLPLSVGARVIIVPDDIQADGPALISLLEESGASIFHATPATWQMLVQGGWSGKRGLKVLTGGEALSSTLAQRLLERCGELWNLYGPTETTIYSLGTRIEKGDPITIGEPMAQATIHIVGPDGQPVPEGEEGELWIGGAGVARGYLNRPDLTAERFLPDSFSSTSQGRLYRSGDLVRAKPDGNIEFLGRLDSQIKIRGFRIELGEIESVLGSHDGVSACAVIARESADGDKAMTAFIVGKGQREPSIQSLREWLGRKLPEYMIPSRFVGVPVLPLNSNGKINRKALAELDAPDLDSGTEYTAPRTERERELVAIWQAVLRRERVGIRDSFFDLGGHSLLALAMCQRITVALQVEVPLRWVLQYPTIEALAGQLEVAQKGVSAPAVMEKADRSKPLLLSFSQQGLWILQQILPDKAAYNEPFAWRLSGSVNRQKVLQALAVMLGRHEILRTALVREGEIIAQHISPNEGLTLPWREIDLRTIHPEGKNKALTEALKDEARKPFDLAQSFLWRAAWIALDEEDHVLIFTFHHSIVDDWSVQLFLRELEALYAADGGMDAVTLPELPVQYADYAAWQRRQSSGPSRKQSIAYWTKQLENPPPPAPLPADQPPLSRPSGGGAVYDFRIGEDVTKGLRTLARQEETTLFTVALAAFQVWLYRYTGQNDLVVCTPLADRERPEVQSLVGCFLNTLPIRTRTEGDRSFIETIHDVRDTVLEAFAHADLPYEQIVEQVGVTRLPGRQPLCDILFVLAEEGLAPLNFAPAQGRFVPVETGTSKADLVFYLLAEGESLACRLEYSTDLFTAERAAAMSRHMTELFRSIAQNPGDAIDRLNLLPGEERHRILVEWNQTDRDYPRDRTIHDLFREQAAQTPEAVAIVMGNQSLSYRDLDRQADRVAGYLRTLGIGPRELVALRMERSMDRVVAILGILKAGGVYWALEENLPEERLRGMLEEARPRVLLTSKDQRSALRPLEAITTVASIEDGLEWPLEKGINSNGPGQATDPAYVNYTSGSTGRPKGVLVPHRGVVRLVKGADYASLGADEVFLHLSPLSFDASTFELWAPLLNGGRVVLLPPGLPSLVDIGEAIRLHGVTTLWLTAGLFHLMVEERLEDLKPLRQLLSGGDVLQPRAVSKVRRAFPRCRMINAYGPTENTTFTTCYTVTDEGEVTSSLPIGRPIANSRIYILDRNRQPVPVGVKGELYAGGDGLACGYLHQPEQTADRFVPDPFVDDPQARLYRTGDLARWRPDGNVEFLGRIDAQVKIRGFRVELGEIETRLREEPEILEAAVISDDNRSGDRVLLAYLVPRGSDRPEAAVLRERLGRKLPDYMLPTGFVWLGQLPLSLTGKIDRRALPAPEAVDVRTQKSSQPVSLLELELLRMWRRLFEREDIDRGDNFFALGGSSLLAVRLAAQIDDTFGHRLPTAALFQSPTIESLARRLSDEAWAPAWSSLVPLQPQGSRPPLFFVHGLGGNTYGFLELAALLGPDQPSYGIQAVDLDGRLPRHETIEAMAAHYVQEIISFQKEGAFYLVGYSMGGLIAFEMARQLNLLGRKVALLALFDTEPLGEVPWFFRAFSVASYLPNRSWHHFRQGWNLPFGEWFDYLAGRRKALRHVLERNKFSFVPLSEGEAVIDPYHAVALRYRLRPYKGKVALFLSDEAVFGWRWYWRYLVEGVVSFHPVPGLHREILSPQNLPFLVRSFSRELRQVQEGSSHAHSDP